MPAGAVCYHINLPPPHGDLEALFSASWPSYSARADWTSELAHSLLTVSATRRGRLIGFVRLAWDGGTHAFVLNPTVHPGYRRRGIGRELIRRAAMEARERGIEWLHVDFEPHLAPFYRDCGFRHTAAGLINLKQDPPFTPQQ